MKREILPQGERRWTAVLCADLVDFTGMSKALGPEKTYEMLGEAMGIAREQIEHHGGHVIEYAGDAIFAVFGAPTALENASLDACRASLAIQKDMALQNPRLNKTYNVDPRFRIGLAGGAVVFGSLGHGEGLDVNVLGDAVNLATRLEKMTEAGRVVCSDAILSQVEGFVEVETQEVSNVKGYTGKQTLHHIISLNDSVSEFEGRMRRGAGIFFGRNDELGALDAWLNEETQSKVIVDVSGPAGVGKSRLLYEFTSRTEPSRRILVGQCNLNIQQATLAPILEIIRTALDWKKGHSTEQVSQLLQKVVPASDAGFPYLVQLLGGFERGAGEYNSETAISVRLLCQKVLHEIARQEKCIYLVEDVHWIDPVSEQLLQSLLDLKDEKDLRVIATRRSHIPCSWTGDSRTEHLPVSPLGETEVYALICHVLSAQDASSELVDLITSKSENNPLFVEEILRYLKFADGIQLVDHNAMLVPGDYGNIVSGNLQHLVLSRFDALPDQDRGILVLAAAKGRQFSELFLAACVGEDSDISACLKRAALEGLIEPDPTGTEEDWRFSHALIGDAIYQSLLGARRREIHATLANALEASSGNRIRLLSDELAVHFQAAGNIKKAVHYLWRSAEHAFEVFSVVHADAQLNAAFDLIEEQPDIVSDDEFGEMLFLWGRTLDIFGNFRKQTAVMEHHLPRLENRGPSALLSMCTSMKALARCHAADFDTANSTVSKSHKMAEDLGLEIPLIWAQVVQMRINVDGGFGSLAETRALYDKVKPAAESLSDNHLIQLSTYVMTAAYRSVGSLGKAKEYADWLYNYGNSNKSARALALASWVKVLNHLVMDEVDEAVAEAEIGLQKTIPPTADWRVATVGKIVAQLKRVDPGIEPEALLPHMEVTTAFEDASLGNALLCQYWIQFLSRGKIRKGWTGLLNSEQQIKGAVSPEMGRFYLLVKAEFLMAVAGIMPSEGPSPKLEFRDILFALRLKIGARKKAEAFLNEFLRLAPFDTGYFVARVKRDLGLLARSRKEDAKADDFFNLSIALYEAEGMHKAAKSVAQLKSPSNSF